jgi:hypothetical protein
VKALHHGVADPPAATVGTDGDGLHVSGAQRSSTVQETPLDNGPVPDDPVLVRDERVHSAERVVPVVVVETALERVVEEGAQCRQGVRIERGCVGDSDVDHRLDAAGRRGAPPRRGGALGMLPVRVREWGTCLRQ